MEKKLVCPNCGEPFEIDEKGYAAIAKQVRDREFKEDEVIPIGRPLRKN